jgi:hypothetical protein
MLIYIILLVLAIGLLTINYIDISHKKAWGSALFRSFGVILGGQSITVLSQFIGYWGNFKK